MFVYRVRETNDDKEFLGEFIGVSSDMSTGRVWYVTADGDINWILAEKVLLLKPETRPDHTDLSSVPRDFTDTGEGEGKEAKRRRE